MQAVKMLPNDFLKTIDEENIIEDGYYYGWSYLRPTIGFNYTDKLIICLIENNHIIGYALLSSPSIANTYAKKLFNAVPTIELSLFEIRKDYQERGLSTELIKAIDKFLDKKTIYVGDFSDEAKLHKLPNNLKKYVKTNTVLIANN